MTENKKMTKKEYFAQIREIVVDNEELVAFIDHEIELLTRKNSSKGASKTQVENESIKNMLVEELAKIGRPVTITELMNESEVVATHKTNEGKNLTNQKISSLLNAMSKAQDRVVRTEDKKKVYFSLI